MADISTLTREPLQGSDDYGLSGDDRGEREPDFLALLDVATEFRLPYLLLDKLGVPEPDREPRLRDALSFGYNIGAGYSGRVIRHVTEHDVGHVKKGTAVALKQFSPKPPEFGKTPKTMETLMFRAARRELKALCHPALRTHENICDVLYIGWHHSAGAYPMIALELAEYGTLENVLTAPGVGLSWLQKMNITIDIALAVHAIHGCGMVHGDLKPSNVVLHHHSVRQVVAKVIDLAGSAELLDEVGLGGLVPSMSTELWWAPEICVKGTQDQKVDWNVADTYSFGLVVASLWGRQPIWSSRRLLSSCFLDKFIPRALTQSQRRDRLVVMKTHGDTHPHSVMQMSWTDERLVNPILLGTLAANPVHRVAIGNLIPLVIPGLATRVRRGWAVPAIPPPLPDQGPTKFEAWTDEYICHTSHGFHNLVFKQLLQDSQPVYSLLDIEPGDLPRLNPHAGEKGDIIQQALAGLKTLQVKAERQLGKNAFGLGRLAFHVAISHCLQVGAGPDEEVVTKSLLASALAGCGIAIVQAPLIARPSSSQRELWVHLRPLYLTVGAILGMKSSLDVLLREYPEIYHAALRALWSRQARTSMRRDGRIRQRMAFSPITTTNLPNTNNNTPSSSLMEALRHHNAARARQLLESDGYDASALDEDGLGAFQALSFLPDEDAASLAFLCLRRGANLQHQVLASTSLCLLESTLPRSGTPLAWAWTFRMPKYFRALLALHAKNNVTISDYRLLLLHCANYHTPLFLEWLLQLRVDAPVLIGSVFSYNLQPLLHQYRHTIGVSARAFEDIFHKVQTIPLLELLRLCLVDSLVDQGGGGLTVVCQRVYHTLADEQGKAEADTLRLLLRETRDLDGALHYVSQSTNTHRLETICDLIADSGAVESYMQVLHETLLAYIWSDSPNDGPLRCFEVLLSRFPDLHNGASTSFMPPLFAAVGRSDPRFAQRLVEMGANIDAQYENLVSPLSVAIWSGRLETAEMLFQRLTETQRRRTFGMDEATNSTMTRRLISSWVQKGRDVDVLQVLDWLQQKGGLEFEACKGEPAWFLILAKKPPPVPEHVRKDAKVLEKLFRAFPGYIGETRWDPEGFMPIHRAVLNGLLEVVKVLVNMGVGVNTETVGRLDTARTVGGATFSYAGRTALDIAATRLQSEPPSDILKGGDQEVKRWRQIFVDMFIYLLSKGAESGSGASKWEGTMLAVTTSQYASLLPGVQRIGVTASNHEEYQSDRVKETEPRSSWPAILKPDRTSLLASEIEHSKRWMRIRCVLTGRLVDISRLLAHSHLGDNFDQPWAGVRDTAPELYGSWLRDTAALRLEVWRRTNRPSNRFVPLPQDPEMAIYEWHSHGIADHRRHLGTPHYTTEERLPRYRVVAYNGSPLRPSSEHDVDLIQLLKALHENALPCTKTNKTNGRTLIITIHDTTRHTAKDVGRAIRNAADLISDPEQRGVVFQFLLNRHERTALTAEEQQLLDEEFGYVLPA
ncbi:hypothetical protein OQA88_13059 [Cercophora sp. LCS_1]